MRIALFKTPPARAEARRCAYVSPVSAAQVLEPAPAAMWAVYLMLVAICLAVGWAAVSQVDIVAKANARVVPDGREQVIASLEGGILRELLVREGQQVTPARRWPCWTRRVSKRSRPKGRPAAWR
jgi:adhesin transport system membrane fusion protein